MQRLLSWCKTVYFWARQLQLRIRELLFAHKPLDFKRIPIIINNFNRVSYLQRLVSALESRGYVNIHIIDNASTYPPLLEYYGRIPYPVYQLKQNVGYLALWKTGLYKKFRNQYFVYTDSDVVPDEQCPADFLEYFYGLMQRYPRASKVGFSLRIDDLPDCFAHKEEVLGWEARFWQRPLDKEGSLYRAAIDTTFALYRPNVKGGAYFHDFMIRTAAPYTARHLPWYVDSHCLSEEDKFYIVQAKTETHWTSMNS